MMFSLFHPLCRPYLAGDTEEISRISFTFCVVGGSHPAQIYLVIDCEVELYTTVYLHFVLDFLFLMYSTPLDAVLCSAFWSPR